MVVPFETEVKRAAVALLEVRNDVFQHPDVSRVSEYIAPTCVCLERERGFVERFVDEGLHWTGPPIEVRGINLSNSDPDAPTLTFVAMQPDIDLVDASGEVAEDGAPADVAPYRVALVRSGDGSWLINGLDTVDLNTPTIDAILAEGLQ